MRSVWTVTCRPFASNSRSARTSASRTGRWHLDAENPGELSAQMAHPALEPVAAMVGDTGGHHFHQTGTIGPDDGHDKNREHAASLESGACGDNLLLQRRYIPVS
jgi:hypothetical protein